MDHGHLGPSKAAWRDVMAWRFGGLEDFACFGASACELTEVSMTAFTIPRTVNLEVSSKTSSVRATFYDVMLLVADAFSLAVRYELGFL